MSHNEFQSVGGLKHRKPHPTCLMMNERLRLADEIQNNRMHLTKRETQELLFWVNNLLKNITNLHVEITFST